MQEAALHISYTGCRADVCDFKESLDFIDRYPNLGNSTFFFILFFFLLSVYVNKLKLSLTICLFPIQSTGACYKFNSSSLEHYSVYTEPINTELKLKFLECLYTESVYKQCHFSLGVGQNLLYHMLAFIWSQKSVNSLIRKQILKAKLAVSPHAVTDKYASSRFPFHRNFSGNNTPFEHSTCHAPFLYFQSCPPVRFPPDLQTNGNVIRTNILSVWFCFACLPGKWKADLTRSDRRLFLQKGGGKKKNTHLKWNHKHFCGLAVECDDRSASAASLVMRS